MTGINCDPFQHIVFLLLEATRGDGVSAADVCLYGINLIMPLMTLELLKFPTLCCNYFRTLTLISEIYPEKICNLTPDLQKNLVLSLELGLTSIGVDVVYQLCCDFIQVSCNYMIRSKNTGAPLFEALRPFLKVNSPVTTPLTIADVRVVIPASHGSHLVAKHQLRPAALRHQHAVHVDMLLPGECPFTCGLYVTENVLFVL